MLARLLSKLRIEARPTHTIAAQFSPSRPEPTKALQLVRGPEPVLPIRGRLLLRTNVVVPPNCQFAIASWEQGASASDHTNRHARVRKNLKRSGTSPRELDLDDASDRLRQDLSVDG